MCYPTISQIFLITECTYPQNETKKAAFIIYYEKYCVKINTKIL